MTLVLLGFLGCIGADEDPILDQWRGSESINGRWERLDDGRLFIEVIDPGGNVVIEVLRVEFVDEEELLTNVETEDTARFRRVGQQ